MSDKKWWESLPDYKEDDRPKGERWWDTLPDYDDEVPVTEPPVSEPPQVAPQPQVAPPEQARPTVFRPEIEPVAKKLGLAPEEEIPQDLGLAEVDSIPEGLMTKYLGFLKEGSKQVPPALLGGLEQAAHLVGKGEVLEVPGIPEALSSIGPGLEEALHEGAEWEGFKPPEGWEGPRNIFEHALYNMPQVVGQIGSYLAAGPAASGMYMFSQIAGQQYHDLVNQGVDKDRATAAALVNAAIQMPLEQIGIGKILKPWAPTQGIAKTLVRWAERATVEGLTEWLQKFPEEITYHIAKNPGAPFGKMMTDILKQIPTWAWEGAKIDAPVGALLGGFFSAPGAMYAIKNDVSNAKYRKARDQEVEQLIGGKVVTPEGSLMDALEWEIASNPNLAFSVPEAFMKLEKDLELPPGQGYVLAANYSNWSPELAIKLTEEKQKLLPPPEGPDPGLLPPGSERKQIGFKREPVDFSVYSPEVAEFLRWVHKPGNFPIEEQRTDASKRQLLPEPPSVETGPGFVHGEVEPTEAAARAVEAALETGTPEDIAQATRKYEQSRRVFDRTEAVIRNTLRKNPDAAIGDVYREARSKGITASRQDIAKLVKRYQKGEYEGESAEERVKGATQELERTGPVKIETNQMVRDAMEGVEPEGEIKPEPVKAEKPEKPLKAKKETAYKGKEFTAGTRVVYDGDPGIIIEPPRGEIKIDTRTARWVKTDDGDVLPAAVGDLVVEGKEKATKEPKEAKEPKKAKETKKEEETEKELDAETKSFIEGRVKELGSIDAVSELYSRNDPVSKYARSVASELFSKPKKKQEVLTVKKEEKRESKVETKKKRVSNEDRDMIRSNIMELRNHPFREIGLNSPQRIWKDFHTKLRKYIKRWAPDQMYLADHFESFMYQDKRDMAINVAEEAMSTLHDAAGKMGLDIEMAEVAQRIGLAPVMDEGFVPYENSIPEDDRLYLVRYHRVEGKGALDPNEQEYTEISGEEKKTRIGSEAPPMYQYYMEGGPEEVQVKALPNKYRTLIPKSKLYDVEADPLNLRAKAKREGMGVVDINLAEKMMKDAGYWGYHIPKSRWPSTVRVWQRLPAHQIPKQEISVSTSYSEGAKGVGDARRNILISDKKKIGVGSGKGRTLLVQISSGTTDESVSDPYFDKLYDVREGFYRPDDFWEIPMWIAEAAHTFPNSDVYVVRSPQEAVDLMNTTGYDEVMFSVLDSNKSIIKDIVSKYSGKVVLGGYVDPGYFKNNKNVTFHKSISDAAKDRGIKYTRGVNYKHFVGTKTVPRLCLSTGCLHKCAFCVVPKKVMAQPTSFVDNQIEAMKDLDFELIYLDDKTFGQASNYKYLSEANKKIRKFNPKFKGFIIQSTAPQFLKLDNDFIQNSGIKYVELGVESYNNDILKRIKKPHNVGLIDEAVAKIRENNLTFIPNILVGLSGKDSNGKMWSEDADSYERTMSFLRTNRDIISHVNIYNLALYEGTELAQQLEDKSDIDIDENQVTRSYHTNSELHEKFYKDVIEFADSRLDLGDKKTKRVKVPFHKTGSEIYDMVRAAFPKGTIESYDFVKNSYFVSLPNGARIEVAVGSLPEGVKLQDFQLSNDIKNLKDIEIGGLWVAHGDSRITGQGLMYLAIPTKGNALHEAFHAAVSMVLTIPEIKYLRERFKGGRHPNPEENAADAYSEFSEKLSNNPVFRKIQLWARRVLNAFGLANHPKVFYDIASGKVWERKLGKPSGHGRIYDAIVGMERHFPRFKKGMVRYYDNAKGKWVEKKTETLGEELKRKALVEDFKRLGVLGAIDFAEGISGAEWTAKTAQYIRDNYGVKTIPKGFIKKIRTEARKVFTMRTQETLAGRLPALEDLLGIEARGAREGGLVWYDEADGLSALVENEDGELEARSAKKELQELFGEDADLVALLVAHLSSSMNVTDNVKKAVDVWVRIKTGMPYSGTHAVPATRGKRTKKNTIPVDEAIEEMKTSGGKRKEFLEAIMGSADAIVIDRWMGRVFNFAKKNPKTGELVGIDNPTENQRILIREWVNRGAKRLGVSNRAYQALLWAGKKAMDEEAKGRPTGTLDPLHKVIRDHINKSSIPVEKIPKGREHRFAILPGDPTRAVETPLQSVDQGGMLASLSEPVSVETTIDDIFGESETTTKKSIKRTLAKAKRWRKYLVDKYEPIKRVLGENMYKMFRMLAGADALFQATLEHGKIFIDENGRVSIDRTAGGAGEFFKRHGEDARNMLRWAALERAKRLEKSYKYKKVKRYSRDSVDRAQAYIDGRPDEQLRMRVTRDSIIVERGRPKERWLVGERRRVVEKHLAESGKTDEFYRNLYSEFKQYHDGILDLAQQMGLITKEQREVWASEVYVPFHRVFETAEGDETSMHPYSADVIGSKLKEIYGAEMKLGDPIENVLANWSYLIKESLRNAAMANALGVAMSIQREEGGQPIASEADKAGPDTISYMDRGQRKYVKLHDFELFQTLRSVNHNAVPGWMRKIFGAPKRWLTYGITRSPAFVLANSTRDTLASWVLTKNFIPVVDSIRGVFHIMTKSDEYVRAMAAGALFGGSYMRADDPKSIQKMAKRMVPKTGRGKILGTLKDMWNFYESFIDASENAARMGIFAKNIKAGMRDYDAAYEARDITDFSNHGASVPLQYLMATVPFLGARAQGNYKFFRGFTENPLSTLAKGGLLALASLGLWAIYADDDRYEELEDWDKWTYYHFWMGGHHYKIPKPFEVGVIFSSAVETAANLITKKEEKEFLKRFIFHTMNQTFAVDMPQLVKPAIEQWANKSFFTGRPIESYRLEGLRPGERYYQNTSELMRVLGRELNISPARMEELVNGYFGTLGAGLLSVADSTTRWFVDFPEKPTARSDDYPLIGRFWKEGPAKHNKYGTRFYDMVKESEQLVKTVKHYMETGDLDEARRLMRSDLTGYSYNKYLTSIRKDLSEIGKAMRHIENSKTLSGEEKRQKLDKYYQMKNRLVQSAYNVYTKAKDK